MKNNKIFVIFQKLVIVYFNFSFFFFQFQKIIKGKIYLKSEAYETKSDWTKDFKQRIRDDQTFEFFSKMYTLHKNIKSFVSKIVLINENEKKNLQLKNNTNK